MRKSGIAALAIIIAVIFSFGFNSNLYAADYTVTFYGKGSVTAAPDQVKVYFTVVGASANSMQEAVSRQATNMASLMDMLKNNGVAEKDVATQSYSFNPVYEYKGGQRVLTGYTAEQRLAARAALSRASVLVDGLSKNPSTYVDSVAFLVSNAAELREQAVALAIKDAQQKAKDREQQIGLKLGTVIGYSEEVYSPPHRPEYRAVSAAGADMPQLPTGEAKIEVTVTLTYGVYTY